MLAESSCAASHSRLCAAPARPTRRRGPCASRPCCRARLSTSTLLTEGALLERLIDVLLERRPLPAAPSAVGGDTDLRFGIVDPIGQRLRREAAEHHRMDRADPRAREHRDRRLGHHRHVDRDAVALLDAQALERVGAAPHFVGEHLVGQDARMSPGSPSQNQRGLVAARACQMAVETVVGGVDLAADEPLRKRQLPFEHFAERLEPIEVARAFGPESFGVRVGAPDSAWYSARLLTHAWALNSAEGANFAISVSVESISSASVEAIAHLSTFRAYATRDRELRAFSSSGTESRRRHFRAGSN